METKTDKRIDQFLETNNMDYLYLILANLEVERLSNLPDFVKKNFTKKISDMALEHTADNDIPDFILEQLELENLENQKNNYRDFDDEGDDDFADMNYNPANLEFENEAVPADDFVPPYKSEEEDDSFEEDDDFDFDTDFDDED